MMNQLPSLLVSFIDFAVALPNCCWIFLPCLRAFGGDLTFSKTKSIGRCRGDGRGGVPTSTSRIFVQLCSSYVVFRVQNWIVDPASADTQTHTHSVYIYIFASNSY